MEWPRRKIKINKKLQTIQIQSQKLQNLKEHILFCPNKNF